MAREGFGKIADKIATVAHLGPEFVADFEDIQDAEDRAARKRDGFERMDYPLRLLKITHARSGMSVCLSLPSSRQDDKIGNTSITFFRDETIDDVAPLLVPAVAAGE